MTELEERGWVLPGEPVPARLMNTIWADTVGVHDDLRDPQDLEAWLSAAGYETVGTRATAEDVRQARALRDAVRRLAALVTCDTREAAASATNDRDVALAILNDACARRPSTRIEADGDQFRIDTDRSVSLVTTGLARVAEQSIELLAGEDNIKLRACNAPGCVLYFVKTHPRREWCSVACGNRARAARHYSKTRSQTN